MLKVVSEHWRHRSYEWSSWWDRTTTAKLQRKRELERRSRSTTTCWCCRIFTRSTRKQVLKIRWTPSYLFLTARNDVTCRFEPAEQPASRESPTNQQQARIQDQGQSSPRKGQPKARRNLETAYSETNGSKKQVGDVYLFVVPIVFGVFKQT